MKSKPPTDKESTTQQLPQTADLEIDMMIQNATQLVTNRYEKEIRKERDLHRAEMQNLTDGMKTWKKPSLWARLTGRYKDIYLVLNHRVPIYCHKTDCEVKGRGHNWGCLLYTSDAADE